jgi:MSHA pilin protein MshD
MCTNKAPTRQRGFTLIELIIFIVVVGVGLVGILQVVNTTVARSADPVVRKQAVALADSILEEILQKAYTDPDGTTGETTRATFDDVDDYNGKTQAIFTDWPSGLSGYQVAITVAAPANLGGSSPVLAKKVTVTVSRGTDVVSLSGYRSSY